MLLSIKTAFTCVFAALARSAVGLLVAALALRLNPGPLVATANPLGLKLAVPVMPLLGAAQSTRVVGATWLPVRLPRTPTGPTPANTDMPEGEEEVTCVYFSVQRSRTIGSK
eukprot:GHRR01037476.1.p2 GENE.GHRR01037476.1~~GHRR01037476.1.p2  ORF type:complete len:112 (+),score=28.12 GHRR01037476.1:172-507(+)